LVGLDRRAPWDAAARKQQLDAVLRVRDLFDDMGALVGKLDAAAASTGERLKAIKADDPLATKLSALAKHIEEERKKVVATKEGGDITGEERIREHADHLYGALNGWEGKPATYQLERIDALKHELDDVKKELDALVRTEVQPLGSLLRAHGLPPIELAARDDDDDDEGEEAVSPVAAVKCWRSRGTDCDVPVEADRRR
jgi:hypothetical protein